MIPLFSCHCDGAIATKAILNTMTEIASSSRALLAMTAQDKTRKFVLYSAVCILSAHRTLEPTSIAVAHGGTRNRAFHLQTKPNSPPGSNSTPGTGSGSGIVPHAHARVDSVDDCISHARSILHSANHLATTH